MKITHIKSQWTEDKGFCLNRRDCGNEYVFIHFLSPTVLHSDYCDIALHSGACILYDKHTAQHFSAPDNNLTFDWFHLKGDLTEQMEKYNLIFNQIYYLPNSYAVTQIVRCMEFEFLQPSAFSEDFTNAKITELLIALTQNTPHRQAKQVDDKTRALLKDTRKRILEQYQKDWNVRAMAKLSKMKPSAFSALYKQCFGTSPKQDLLSCRMEHAKFMCLQGDLSVDQIAHICGYTSTSHFIRQFKIYTGATPKKFICL